MFIQTKTEIRELPKPLLIAVESREAAARWKYRGSEVELPHISGRSESHTLLLKRVDEEPIALAFGRKRQMEVLLASIAFSLRCGHNLFDLDQAIRHLRKRADC